MKTYHILTINPGSTSTKIGVFKNEECLFEINVSHSPKQLEQFSQIWDQYTFRKEEIITVLEKNKFSLKKLDAVVGRGGLIKPIPSGVYLIDQEMIEDARSGYQGHHASNLGCVIAYSIGWEYSLPAFIVDPPAVNDLEALAKVSGHKKIERGSSPAFNINAPVTIKNKGTAILAIESYILPMYQYDISIFPYSPNIGVAVCINTTANIATTLIRSTHIILLLISSNP